MTITFVILVVAILLFLSDRLRPDLVALLVMLALGLSGVLTAEETFSGFSRSAVITIISIFVLAEALRRTGFTERLGQLLIRLGGKREGRLVFTVTLAGAALSLFMNNIAAASVLLPAVSIAARNTRISPSRLLIPLAFGTMLGGMATLLTTANILASGILREHGLDGFGLLDFAPVGIPVVIAGTLYLSLVGRRLLPVRPHPILLSALAEDDLPGLYRLNERLIRGRVFSGSPLDGKQICQCELREKYKLNIIAVQRGKWVNESPAPDMPLKSGDVLHLIGRLDLLPVLELEKALELLTLADAHLPEMGLVEVVLTPRSELLGKTLREAHFREKYNLNVLAIWRTGRAYRTGHADLPLQFGDALLLQGLPERISLLKTDSDLLVLTGKKAYVKRDKAILAALVMLVTLAVATFAPLPSGEVMLGGALLMVLLGVLDMDQAYRAVEWKSVLLVAGMLPLGTALAKTGAAARLSDALVDALGDAGVFVLLAVLLGITIACTQFMNGAAVVAIMAPIAIQVGRMVGDDPRALVMGIALATSVAFITPLGHPVSVLVMGQGGYKFRDYARVGVLLTLIVFGVILVCLPFFWSL